MVTIRQGAASMHARDGLMQVAFDGIGSLSMAVIDKHRQAQQKEVSGI